MTKNLSTVLCVGRHAVDLDGGRTLGVGETAEGIDLDTPHNRGLVLDGHIRVLDGMTPRTRQDEERAAAAERLAAERAAADAAAQEPGNEPGDQTTEPGGNG